MLQELFRIPGTSISIHGYGLMLVIGFLLAVQLAKFLSRRAKIDPEIFVNAGLIALITGVIGARLSHILENLGEYTDPSRTSWANFLDAVNVTSGGLTYYGGFLLAFPCTIAYGIYKKVPLRTGMDIIAPCLMIGLGIGRVGCFLNGCCYGEQCNVAWGVKFPYYSNAYLEQVQRGQIVPDAQLYGDDRKLMTPDDLSAHYKNRPGYADQLMATERAKGIKVQPAELYSTFTALLLAALLVAYFSLPHVPGNVFALMCILEGASRFMLEMLRVEPPILHSPLSLSMWIGVILVIAGAGLWFEFSRAGGRNQGGQSLSPAVA
jgi:phosphatidylglycerol:prolipoprotein diacylglycerol transferase